MAELFREENCWTGRPGGLLDSFRIHDSIRWRLSSCLCTLDILVRLAANAGILILLVTHDSTIESGYN